MPRTSPEQFTSDVAGQQPADTTILITGIDNQTWISLPESGNLWVAYEYQGQPAQVWIWHQGGQQTPVPPGFNTYPVNATDAIVYELSDPNQSIKLGWAYV